MDENWKIETKSSEIPNPEEKKPAPEKTKSIVDKIGLAVFGERKGGKHERKGSDSLSNFFFLW